MKRRLVYRAFQATVALMWMFKEKTQNHSGERMKTRQRKICTHFHPGLAVEALAWRLSGCLVAALSPLWPTYSHIFYCIFFYIILKMLNVYPNQHHYHFEQHTDMEHFKCFTQINLTQNSYPRIARKSRQICHLILSNWWERKKLLWGTNAVNFF